MLPLMLALGSCGGGSDSTIDTDRVTTNAVDEYPDPATDEESIESIGSEVTGDIDTANNDGNLIRSGFLSIAQFSSHPLSPDRKLGISAVFYEFTSTATQSDLVERLNAPKTEGCQIFRPSDELYVEATNPGISSPKVSAGEAITITSPAGTYTSLDRMIDGDSISYAPQTPLTGQLSAGLIADIPGDVFSAYSNVAIPDVAEFRLNSPSVDETFSTSTPITWDANSDSNSFIVINVAFTVVATGEWVMAVCSAIDDGAFSLPASAISELDLTDNHVPSMFGISRTADKVETSGSSALYITNGFSESFFYLAM
jgi:hypothetical protein